MQAEEPIAGYNGNPQIQDGFTRIANELLDAMLSFDFSKRQQKVLLAIVRKTYGYNKKQDDITVSQLAEITGMAAPHVSTALKELANANAITLSSGQYGKVICINKLYDQWKVTKTVTVTKSVITKTVTDSYQNGNSELPKRSFGVTKTVHTIDNPKRQYQKTIPKDNTRAIALAPDGISNQVWEDFKTLRKSKKAPITKTALAGISREASKAGISLQTALQACCERGWQGFKADWWNNAVRGSPPAKPMNKADRFNAAMDKAFGKQEDQNEYINGTAKRVD